MLRSLATRLRCLEARTQDIEEAFGQGLSGLLAYVERHHLRPTPIKDLTHAELEAQIADLKAKVAAGARGLTPLLLEALEQEQARRQVALA